MSTSQRCIVIGASAGGLEPLRTLVAQLPADLPAAVFVVLHIPPFAESTLPTILGRCGPLPAIHPQDGETIKPGMIYIAPPDHHMLMDGQRIAVKKGPKENRFRPSIDALFRSAAYEFGPQVIGVVLSGALNDGTSGLWSIERLGGITIVQHPDEASFESMPRSALEYIEVDHMALSRDIAPLLARLVREPLPTLAVELQAEELARIKTEIGIAGEVDAFRQGVMKLGPLTPFTCPDCHGVLVRIPEGKRSRFRCHTGHAYTDSSLLEAVMETSGQYLWQVIRSLEESELLLADMAKHLEGAGAPDRATFFYAKARELEKRSHALHALAFGHKRMRADILGQEQESEIPTD